MIFKTCWRDKMRETAWATKRRTAEKRVFVLVYQLTHYSDIRSVMTRLQCQWDTDKTLIPPPPTPWTWRREVGFHAAGWNWTETLPRRYHYSLRWRWQTRRQMSTFLYSLPLSGVQVVAAKCFTKGQDWNVPVQHKPLHQLHRRFSNTHIHTRRRNLHFHQNPLPPTGRHKKE